MSPTEQTTETNRETATQTETTQSGNGSAFAATDHFENLPDEVGEETETPETQSETETSEQETEGGEAQVEGEETESEIETGDDWLPNEQSRQFPLETLVEFATKRGYGLSQEDIAGNPGIQKMLRDKLNTDIEIKRLRDLQETESEEEETNPFQETQTEEQPVTPATETADPQKQHYELVDNIVASLPQAQMDSWGKEILAVYGVDTDVAKLQQALTNPKLTPEQRANVTQALTMANNAGKLAQVQARGVIDLVMTLLPQILPQVHEQLYPGTQERWQRQQAVEAAVSAWNTISTLQDKGTGKPLFDGLPKFGTPEMRDLVVKTEEQLGLQDGALGAMRFTDAKGQPLSPRKNAEYIYRMVARVAKGQKPTGPNTETLRVAHETGRRKEQEVNNRRERGRAMGAGLTSRAFKQEKTGDGMRDALRSVISEDEAESSPFSHPKWKESV